MADTYAELQQEVLDWLIREDAETVAMVPRFIVNAERRFNRVLRVPEMETVTTIASAASVSLPADFLEARSITIGGPPASSLEPMSAANLAQRYPTASGGIPRNYAVSGGTLSMRPLPGTGSTLSLVYYAKIPPLTDDNPTNWLLLAHPDLYLAAAVAEGFTYTRDVDARDDWLARMNAAIGEIQMAGRKKSAGGGPLVRRV